VIVSLQEIQYRIYYPIASPIPPSQTPTLLGGKSPLSQGWLFLASYDPAVADLEHFRNTWSAGFFIDRLQ